MTTVLIRFSPNLMYGWTNKKLGMRWKFSYLRHQLPVKMAAWKIQNWHQNSIFPNNVIFSNKIRIHIDFDLLNTKICIISMFKDEIPVKKRFKCKNQKWQPKPEVVKKRNQISFNCFSWLFSYENKYQKHVFIITFEKTMSLMWKMLYPCIFSYRG